jgi:hypothetical protein
MIEIHSGIAFALGTSNDFVFAHHAAVTEDVRAHAGGKPLIEVATFFHF